MRPQLARRRERAFQRMYRRHVGDVYRYTLAVLGDPMDAEEVTQTTFLNAHLGFREGKSPRLQLNALLAIAHDVCRIRGSYQELEDADLLGEEKEETATARDVRRALGRLPFDQRTVLVMRELEGRSYGEIAEILAVSVSVVEAYIFQARQALREELEGAFTCHKAERAISRHLDDRLSRGERRLLRAHLRSCGDCEAFALCQLAQRASLRALAAIPLPDTLQSFAGSRRERLRARRRQVERKFLSARASP